VTHFTGQVLQVRILGGDHAGETAFIPRITLTPSNLDLPFKLERRQFPVRLAFAMSINKAQGQSVRACSATRIRILCDFAKCEILNI
jgi:hypothetical protein